MAKSNNDISRVANILRSIAIIFLVLMVIAPLGTRAGLWPYTLSLPLTAIALLGSLLIQIIIAIWFLGKPPAATKRLLRQASFAALLPLLVIGSIMSSMVGDGNSAGVIHNISTDIKNPPQFNHALAIRPEGSNPVEFTTDVAEIQQRKYPELAPINSPQPTEQAFAKALQVAEAMGWEILAQSPSEGIIEAVDTTFWFGFKDDIVIRVQATENGSKIDLHSVSRVGKSDMGANAKRIQAYIKEFNQQ